MNIRLLFVSVLMAGWLSGCLPYEEEIAVIDLDLQDPDLQKLLDYGDRHQADSIFPYFEHEEASFRYAAVMAFASIKKPEYTDTLASLLQDRNDVIRAAVAFAIGQSGDDRAEEYLLNSFERYDTSGYYDRSNRAILEAIGKCGSKDLLQSLADITTYHHQDTALLEGQSLGIYRYALRGITNPAGTAKMVDLALDRKYPASVRLIATNYLYRASSIMLDSFAAPLAASAKEEDNPNIRMALVIALGKTGSPQGLETLTSLFETETDYRVKCNILRAFGNFDYAQTQGLVLQALKDQNPHVAQRAAQFFVDYGIPEDAVSYRRTAKDTLDWPVQVAMYRAANRHLPSYFADTRGVLNYELRRKFEQAINPYEKAAIVGALAEFPWNYRFLYGSGFKDSSVIVRTASISALSNISNREDLRKFFGSGYRTASRELASYFKEAVQSGDPGMMTSAAEALRNPERQYEIYLDSLGFLDEALAKVSLPQKIETYNALKQTIDHFAGVPDFTPQQVEYNHPIDWTVINDLQDNVRAAIRTSKGTITIDFFPAEAPGSVVNFIKLANAKYFNGKNFHRVVPNFVVQGGCSRGDGYGGLNYTIRSELSQMRYDEEGYVGMARAGLHTEGTQFFITHSPTMHLDGNYTIFGKVTANTMNVVHRLEIGDRIESVSIRNQ